MPRFATRWTGPQRGWRPKGFGLLLSASGLLLLTGCQGLSPANHNTVSNDIAISSSSLNFGTVGVGGSKTMPETLSNPSTSTITVSQASATGSGFSIKGLALPVSLSPNQQVAFTVVFAPKAAGSATGSLTIVSDAANSPLGVALSGTVSAPGTLAANPSSLAFGNVQAGGTANLPETLTNTGGASLTISQANVTGTAFSISGLSLPVTLDPNQSVTFTATFSPTGAGPASETLTVVSDASDPSLGIGLSGTGTAASQLSVSPASLDFGTVSVGSSSALNASLSATGGAVTVSSASANSSEFVLSGISLPLTIQAGQSAPFTVTFTPNASGSASAKLRFASDASNSPTDQSLSGTGQAVSHSVKLSWQAVQDAASYNIYRKLSTDNDYTQIVTGISRTTYTDTSVASGNIYDYAVTSVDADNQESGFSNIAKATIPSN